MITHLEHEGQIIRYLDAPTCACLCLDFGIRSARVEPPINDEHREALTVELMKEALAEIRYEFVGYRLNDGFIHIIMRNPQSGELRFCTITV